MNTDGEKFGIDDIPKSSDLQYNPIFTHDFKIDTNKIYKIISIASKSSKEKKVNTILINEKLMDDEITFTRQIMTKKGYEMYKTTEGFVFIPSKNDEFDFERNNFNWGFGNQ